MVKCEKKHKYSDFLGLVYDRPNTECGKCWQAFAEYQEKQATYWRERYLQAEAEGRIRTSSETKLLNGLLEVIAERQSDD